MNTRKTNEENIKKLEQTEPVFNDNNKEKSKIDLVTAEPPLAFARKLATWAALLFWAVAFVMLLGGGDFRAMLPFLLFSVAAVALLNIPAFIAKKKYFDTVVAVAAGVILLVTGVSLLLIK